MDIYGTFYAIPSEYMFLSSALLSCAEMNHTKKTRAVDLHVHPDGNSRNLFLEVTKQGHECRGAQGRGGRASSLLSFRGPVGLCFELEGRLGLGAAFLWSRHSELAPKPSQ